MPVMDADQLNQFFADAFQGERMYVVEHVDDQSLRARQSVVGQYLRPGGTVSGPTQMALADAAGFALVLAHLGPGELAATSSMNMVFLRKPQPVDVIGVAEFLKLGRTLAVVDVMLYSDGLDEPIAQATVTYAIPTG